VTDRERAERLLFLAEHLFEMIDRETWRAEGAEYMGQYEGDHHAESVLAELRDHRAALAVQPSGHTSRD
jgi:hypothetical protein